MEGFRGNRIGIFRALGEVKTNGDNNRQKIGWDRKPMYSLHLFFVLHRGRITRKGHPLPLPTPAPPYKPQPFAPPLPLQYIMAITLNALIIAAGPDQEEGGKASGHLIVSTEIM